MGSTRIAALSPPPCYCLLPIVTCLEEAVTDPVPVMTTRSRLRPCPEYRQEDPANGFSQTAASGSTEALWVVQTKHGYVPQRCVMLSGRWEYISRV